MGWLVEGRQGPLLHPRLRAHYDAGFQPPLPVVGRTAYLGPTAAEAGLPDSQRNSRTLSEAARQAQILP